MIENGGVVANDDAYLGKDLGSSGVVTVRGVGSQWKSSGDVFSALLLRGN